MWSGLRTASASSLTAYCGSTARLISFRESVKKLVLDFAGPAPEEIACPGMVHSWHSGSQLELVLVGYDDSQCQAVETLIRVHFTFCCTALCRAALLFIVKLFVGAADVLAVNSFMLGLYGWWSATAGNHPSPFFWSMTLPSWTLGVSLLLVYLSGFLCGGAPSAMVWHTPRSCSTGWSLRLYDRHIRFMVVVFIGNRATDCRCYADCNLLLRRDR